MQWVDSGMVIVVAIIVMSTVGWIATSWIRAKHGYPLENEWNGLVYKDEQSESARQVALLTSENGALKAQLGKVEERLAVLERIAVEPAERTAREIEQLRHNA